MDIKAILQYTLETMIRGWMYGKSGIEQHVYSWGLKIVDGWVKEFNSGLEIGAEDFSPLGSVFYWDKIYKTIKNINQELAISSNLGDNIEASFKGALVAATDIGVTVSELATAYAEFSTAFGRVAEYSSNELVRLAEFKEVFKVSGAELFSAYKLTGLSIERASVSMQKLVRESSKVGVIAKNVMEELKKNISAIDRFSFKNGIAGMQSMAKFAEKTKISMADALGFTDKLLGGGLEGVVEFGANMQLMGGQFASVFGDFNQLMYDLRNQPEVFQEKLQQAAKTAVELNKITGELQINPLNMAMLRQMAENSGVTLENLSKSGKAGFTQDAVDRFLDASLKAKSNYKDILSVFAGAAQFEEGTGRAFVQMGDIKKYISDLNEADYERLQYVSPTTNDADIYKALIHSNESLTESIQRLIDQLKLRMIGDGGYKKMDDFTKKGVNDIDGMIASSPALQAFMKRFSELSDQTVSHFIGAIKQMGSFNGTSIFDAIQTGVTAFATLAHGLGEIGAKILPLLASLANGISELVGVLKKFLPSSGTNPNDMQSTQGFISNTSAGLGFTALVDKTNIGNELLAARMSMKPLVEGLLESEQDRALYLSYLNEREEVFGKITEMNRTLNFQKAKDLSDNMSNEILKGLMEAGLNTNNFDKIDALINLQDMVGGSNVSPNSKYIQHTRGDNYVSDISRMYRELEIVQNKYMSGLQNWTDAEKIDNFAKMQSEYQKILVDNSQIIAKYNMLTETLKRYNPNFKDTPFKDQNGVTDQSPSNISINYYAKGEDIYGWNEQWQKRLEEEVTKTIKRLEKEMMEMRAKQTNTQNTTGGN